MWAWRSVEEGQLLLAGGASSVTAADFMSGTCLCRWECEGKCDFLSGEVCPYDHPLQCRGIGPPLSPLQPLPPGDNYPHLPPPLRLVSPMLEVRGMRALQICMMHVLRAACARARSLSTKVGSDGKGITNDWCNMRTLQSVHPMSISLDLTAKSSSEKWMITLQLSTFMTS